MTTRISLLDVVSQLATEGLLDEDGKARADAFVASRSFSQPWYIRTMVAIGAWLASLLLISFVTGFTLAFEGGYAFVGLALVLAAVVVRRNNDSDFLVQASMAVSLAGQALLSWGIVEAFGSNNHNIVLSLAIVLCSVMFGVFPDRIHRTLMVLFAAVSTTALLYSWELNAVVPLVGPLLTAAAVYLHSQQSFLIARGFGHYVRPLMNGLVLSAFGVLLLSTVYILPELGTIEPQIYPRPWLSTVLFGAIFLGVGAKIGASLADSINRASRLVITLLMFAVIGASWFAPGLILALIVVTLGVANGHKALMGAGIAFFVVFLATYFYGIEVTLRTKSMTLVATGVSILLARWLVLRILAGNDQGGRQNA
ncbi:DUF4401 domain-containing protein [Woeseia oceani]|uniref:DUF4401 domain-containing protein n=1 Tax=Woeseia oceani TaxID=1548547 RepID=A0A193LGF0_9GAMM|nr:DUF4401 domain-containing protein [Woeseia oceani]ANO51620.1 hypothetical protein BA177_10775 [Woeseia oceani]